MAETAALSLLAPARLGEPLTGRNDMVGSGMCVSIAPPTMVASRWVFRYGACAGLATPGDSGLEWCGQTSQTVGVAMAMGKQFDWIGSVVISKRCRVARSYAQQGNKLDGVA